MFYTARLIYEGGSKDKVSYVTTYAGFAGWVQLVKDTQMASKYSIRFHDNGTHGYADNVCITTVLNSANPSEMPRIPNM